ncbi:MAG: PH domain-containing protein [Eggerthellaceae bacterium]|nr:PH domain-containing protein [Eggerthellaceae bacterium]
MVWRISDGLWILVLFLIVFLPTLWISLSIRNGAALRWLLITEIVLFVIALVLFILIIPPIRFIRWRYDITNDYLDIARGIIWRRRFIIPFIRVQNTDTTQGPILRAFGLSTVTVSTAAGAHEIPGLAVREAEILRDKAAELARIAKEDV